MHGPGTSPLLTLGVFTYPSGDTFEGTWENGKKTGKGAELGDNGEEYKGDWVDGKYEGEGIKLVKS